MIGLALLERGAGRSSCPTAHPRCPRDCSLFFLNLRMLCCFWTLNHWLPQLLAVQFDHFPAWCRVNLSTLFYDLLEDCLAGSAFQVGGCSGQNKTIAILTGPDGRAVKPNSSRKGPVLRREPSSKTSESPF